MKHSPHEALLRDLSYLLQRASEGAYNDHISNSPTPKADLVGSLQIIIESVKSGLYDQKSVDKPVENTKNDGDSG